VTGQTFKRCGCRAADGKQVGGLCPLLPRTGHGTWCYRVDIGPGMDEDGVRRQRRQRSRGGFATKRDATAALTALAGRVGNGSHVDVARLTVGTYLGDWLVGKGALRPSTARSYQAHLDRYLLPYLGHLRLADLRTVDIERMYAAIAKGNAGRERPVGPATMRRIHATLQSALNTAVKRRVLAFNPAAHVELAAAPRPRVTVWSPEQVGAFLDHTEGDRLSAMYHVIATMGLRRGEAVGVRWQDVDLARGTLHVEQQVVQLGYATAVGLPKTKSGVRVVSLDEQTVEALRTHRAEQSAERLAWGSAWVDTGLVFTREDGAQLHPEYVSRHFGRLTAAAGLPPIRLHDLRHTSASLGLAAGESLVEVQRRLGHSSITITADTYTHVLPAIAQGSSAKRAAIIPRAVTALRAHLGGSVPTPCPQGSGNDAGPSPSTVKGQVSGVRRQGLEPRTRGLRVRCSAN